MNVPSGEINRRHVEHKGPQKWRKAEDTISGSIENMLNSNGSGDRVRRLLGHLRDRPS